MNDSCVPGRRVHAVGAVLLKRRSVGVHRPMLSRVPACTAPGNRAAEETGVQTGVAVAAGKGLEPKLRYGWKPSLSSSPVLSFLKF